MQIVLAGASQRPFYLADPGDDLDSRGSSANVHPIFFIAISYSACHIQAIVH
jgi:hypothetical protein